MTTNFIAENISHKLWIETSLGKVSDYINRGINPNYSASGVIVINQRCIRDGKVSLKDSRITDPKRRKIPEDKLLKSWDIVICSTGIGTLGRVAQIKEIKQEITVDSHVTIVRCSEKSNKLFLGFWLKGKERQIEYLAEGSTGQTELPRKKLIDFTINLPLLPEQKAIADILSSFDEKIELLREQNETLETIVQTIFKERFVNFNYPDDTGERVDSELGKIPKGWRVGNLLEIFELVGGGTPKTSIKEYWEGDIPL